MKAIEMKASVLLAQATPRLVNMALAKSLNRVSMINYDLDHPNNLRETCTESGSEQVVACEYTGRILGISVRQIIQDRVEEQE